MLHRVLERQIKRSFGAVQPETSSEWKALLQAVSDTYLHSDEDRALLLRSLDLSSREFADLNKKLKSENEIIERKVAERTRELKYEQEKLAIITQHMSTGTILLDSLGRVTFANKAVTDLLLGEEAELLAILTKHFAEVPVGKHIQEALGGDSVTVPEAEALGKIFSLSFSSLKDGENVLGALIWLNDITAQKLLDRGKNQFIAIASHEMRTPLAIIRGNAELMLDDPAVSANPEMVEGVKSILKGAVRLLGIVNDFLDLQNLESGKILLKPEPVDILALLRETMSDFSTLAAEKNLSLTLEEPPHAIQPLSIDRSRLQQICINFISNAIHYTQQGGVTISLEQSNASLRVLFRDTGVGIDAEDQGRLFNKFVTGKSFLKTKEYGSGLGLYICSLLARAMGCEVRLEKSELGAGSVFSLAIPLVSKDKTPGV